MQIRSIREAAFDYLCHVVYYRDCSHRRFPKNVCQVDFPNARSVGLPYLEVQKLLKEEFPTCRTSLLDIYKYAQWLRQGVYPYHKKCAQIRPRMNSIEAKENVFKIPKKRKRR